MLLINPHDKPTLLLNQNYAKNFIWKVHDDGTHTHCAIHHRNKKKKIKSSGKKNFE